MKQLDPKALQSVLEELTRRHTEIVLCFDAEDGFFIRKMPQRQICEGPVMEIYDEDVPTHDDLLGAARAAAEWENSEIGRHTPRIPIPLTTISQPPVKLKPMDLVSEAFARPPKNKKPDAT